MLFNRFPVEKFHLMLGIIKSLKFIWSNPSGQARESLLQHPGWRYPADDDFLRT